MSKVVSGTLTCALLAFLWERRVLNSVTAMTLRSTAIADTRATMISGRRQLQSELYHSDQDLRDLRLWAEVVVSLCRA